MRLVLLLTIIVLAASSQVDNLNLLLPQLSSSSPNLPLQLINAQGGCYQWASSAPEILSVKVNTSTTCSKQAIVQVAQAGPFSSSIFVTASDADSDSILNIPVRIRKLSKISIVTKSRMMNLKQIQKLQLFAFDADQNTFTSLEGLRFTWRLQQKTQIIEAVALQHAHLYLPLRTRQNIQKKGFQSDILVVRALAPGNLKIIARCIEPGYQNLSNQITLSVHERFQLKPGPVIRVAPGAQFQLSLVRPTQDIISLPQSYYNIISCEGFSINSTLFMVAPNKLGSCIIKVEDTRTKPAYDSSVEVIVENPDEIRIIVDPIIIVGTESPFQVQLLHKTIPLLGQTKQLRINSDFIINHNSFIRSDKKMTGLIRAEFQSLKKQAKVNSLLQIAVVLPSNSLHFPVDQNFKLKVLGGSGLYDYTVSNQIAVINSQGVLICKQVGNAHITVADRNLPTNKVSIKLKVSAIGQINSLQQNKQVNRDEWGFVYVIAKNQQHQTYTQCLQSQYSFSVPAIKLQLDKKVDFVDSIQYLANSSQKLVQQAIAPTSLLKGRQETIIKSYSLYVHFDQIKANELRDYVNSLENYGICEAIRFKSQIGLAERSTISLAGNQQIKVQLPLRVYEPLTTIIKEDNTAFLMTPLSSLVWNYAGGSYAWPNSITNLTLNSAKVHGKPIISCLNRQTPVANYELKLFNERTPFLLFPTYQKTNISITCKYPKKLQLSLEHGQAYQQIFINANTSVKGSVTSLDQLNNIFYNSSNVKYQYASRTGIIEGIENAFGYKSKGQSDKVKIFTETLKEGLSFFKVELQFILTVVEPLKIHHLLQQSDKDTHRNFTIITLFTPKKPYILNIKNNSPLLSLQCTQAVSCDRSENAIIVKLLSTGHGEVVIRDKRIYGNSQWNFKFIIVEANEIQVTGERNFIQEGETFNVSILNFYNGKVISPLLYQTSSLQLLLHRNLRILQQEDNRFLVKAELTGNYQIYGEQSFPTLRSKYPFKLHVYNKIQLNIAGSTVHKVNNVMNIEAQTTVILGCKRIIRIQGGPQQMSISHTVSGLTVNSLNKNSYKIVGSNEGSYFAQFTASYQTKTIAIIKLKVIVSVIQSVELSSIQEPIVNAQFRILPKFRVGESEVEECSCNFEYKWKIVNNLIRLGKGITLGYLSAAGINATALIAGNQIVSLEVIQRSTSKVIGKASRHIQILNQIDLKLPHIIDSPLSGSTSFLIPPQTIYSFPNDYSVEVEDNLLKVGLQKNRVESFKKTGQSFLRINKLGYRTQVVEVQILPISGLFIANSQSFLTIEPSSSKKIKIYLQDKHGRLFVSPLLGLQLIVSSSNSQLLQVTLSSDSTYLNINALKSGTCIIKLGLAGKSVQDVLAVSIGSQISPSAEVTVLNKGNVHFTLPDNQKISWISSNSEVAQIQQKTGLLKAKAVGKSQISSGDLTSLVFVNDIDKVQEVQRHEFKQGKFQIIYKFMWQGKHGIEQLPHLSSAQAINNNFKPVCEALPKNTFKATTEIVELEGHQRLLCKVQLISSLPSNKLPDSLVLVIKNNDDKEVTSFKYPFESDFTFNERDQTIQLTASRPTYTITITTSTPITVSQIKGRREWTKTEFDSGANTQTVTVDMTGETQKAEWSLQLTSGQQKQTIYLIFSPSGESHSFWQMSLDWPDYLIIFMGVIFAGVCLLQYLNQKKFKNS